VSSAGFDAVVRHGPIVDSRLMAWKLAPSRRLLVASIDYLKQHGTPHNAAELEGHRGIFYTNRGVADWRFVGPNGAVIVRAKVALRVNHGDMIRDAAVAGLGIALLPTFIAGPAIRDGSLIVIDVGIQAEDEFIYIAHPEGRRPSAKLRALADHLRKAFGSPPYWEP
jgi:DNA-binding transcriptional LysR family regulator